MTSSAPEGLKTCTNMNPRSYGYLSKIADKVVSKKKVYAIWSARKLGMLMVTLELGENQSGSCSRFPF